MTNHGEISLNTQRNKAPLMRSNGVGGKVTHKILESLEKIQNQ